MQVESPLSTVQRKSQQDSQEAKVGTFDGMNTAYSIVLFCAIPYARTAVQTILPLMTCATYLAQHDFFGYVHGVVLHGSCHEVGPLKLHKAYATR